MMKQETLCAVMRKCKEAENVVIVGAGVSGKELYGILKQSKKFVTAFFDNSTEKIGTKIDLTMINKPYKLENTNCLYIISIRDFKKKMEMFKQLIGLGINEKEIILYNDLTDPEYISHVNENEYPEIANSMYLKVFGHEIDFENPITYNEKINIEKIYSNDPIRTRLADKVEVRKWIKEQIGEKYLTKWYGVWDNVDDINFDKLPMSFALKMNNGSGRNILVKDKSRLDVSSAKKQLNEWKKINYAFTAMELHYK